MAGEVAKRATSEVLYMDALVGDGAMKYNRRSCRTLTDYEKYYNVIQTASCEAVEECMGVPLEAIAITAEAFSGLPIVIETRWGFTPPIVPNREFVQGSVSGPEKKSPRNPPFWLSVRSVRHSTLRSTGERFMLPGLSMTPSIMEAVHQILRLFCASFGSVVLQLGLASPGQSSQLLRLIGMRPPVQLVPHSPPWASKQPDGISGTGER